jgi:arsenite-transporting ATPase
MVGMSRLRRLAGDLFQEHDPSQLFFRGQAQTIEEEGEDFVLRLPLPQVELDKVKLTKRGDELVCQHRQLQARAAAALGAGAARCQRRDFTDGVLKIRFPPPEGAPAMV